jgi:hypothetical protein
MSCTVRRENEVEERENGEGFKSRERLKIQ